MPRLERLAPAFPLALLAWSVYSAYARPGGSLTPVLAGCVAGVIVGLLAEKIRLSRFWGYLPACFCLLLIGGWWLDRASLSYLSSLGEKTFALSPSDILAVRRALTLVPLGVGGLVLLTLALRGKMDLNTGHSVPARRSPLDLKIGRCVIPLRDRYLHTFVIGATGTGKTSCALKPMIWQDLQNIKKGHRLGITVVDPKGDLARDVAGMCSALGIPSIFIDPLNPASPGFNPLVGEIETVRIIMQTVLRGLFGRQEAFFRYTQEETLTHTIYILKQLRGDDVTIADMLEFLRKPSLMQAAVEELERRDGPSEHTEYFRYDVLSENLKEKMNQFTLGLRLQLGQITGNPLVNRILSTRKSVDLDRHLAEGGVLIVNTALGELGILGDVFGQLFIMHLQQAIFHRPGNEDTRIPHFLYIDEFSRYVNQYFEPMLSMGRSYRCGAVLALQSTFQMKLEGDPEFRRKVLSNCRNKIVFNLEEYEDAKYFASEFGSQETVEKDKTYSRDQTFLFPMRWSSMRETRKEKERFPYTKLMELRKFHAVIRTIVDDQPQQPVIARLRFSPYDRSIKPRMARARQAKGKLDVRVPQHEPRLEVVYREKRREEGSFFD